MVKTETHTVKTRSPTYTRQGSVKLRVIAGPDAGREFKLDIHHTRRVRGGRGAVNELVLNDDLVSGIHFELDMREPDTIVLRDLESRNGIESAGMRVREAVIRPRSTFTVGATRLQLLEAVDASIEISTSDHFESLYGWCDAMREVFVLLERIARKGDAINPILIGGETGTGKDLVAKGLHLRSPRRRNNFVLLDCASIKKELFESELFGHKKGAFNGADHRRGLLADADRGTLFIDEVGDLPLELQSGLLRFLETGEFRPVGGNNYQKSDVRVIAATHRDLRRMVDRGTFRRDLYFRLFGGIPLTMPPLRERGDDVLLLAERFLRLFSEEQGLPRSQLTTSAIESLRNHHWPGNVRELRRVMRSAAALADDGMIRVGDLLLEDTNRPHEVGGIGRELIRLLDGSEAEAKNGFERIYYTNLLAKGGTYGSLAKRAGVTEQSLRNKRKKFNLCRSTGLQD